MSAAVKDKHRCQMGKQIGTKVSVNPAVWNWKGRADWPQ